MRQPTYDPEYIALRRSLQRKEGFGLYFVECTPIQAQQLYETLRHDLSTKRFDLIHLLEPIENLYSLLITQLQQQPAEVVFVQGLELSFEGYIKAGLGGEGDYYREDTVPRVLGYLNLQREKFKQRFPIKLVFVLPYFGLKFFIRRAADFFDWRSGVFRFRTDQGLLEKQIQHLLEDTDYQAYQTMTHRQRFERLIELQNCLEDSKQPEEKKIELLRQKCRILDADEQLESAIACFRRVVVLQPQHPMAWVELGNALFNLGQLEEAIVAYRKQIEIQPNHEGAWNNSGVALRRQGKLEEAIEAYQKQIEIQPNHKYAWDNLGDALKQQGKLEEAIEAYRKQIEIQPNHEYAWDNLGDALKQQGKLEEAIEVYQKQIEIQPNHECAWDNLGDALKQQGKLEEAIEVYRKQIETQPSHKYAWDNLGDALKQQGKLEEANAAYQRQIEVQANHERPQDNLEMLQKQLEKRLKTT